MTIYKHTVQEDQAKQHVLKESVTLEGWPEVKGYDFEGPFDFAAFLAAYKQTGFQATKLAEAIEIIQEMRREKATIFLAFTSNMISSGVREAIRFLVKHKLVDVMVTTAGGVEEDIIKCFKPFVLGSFDTPGRLLREQGINRTGNLFIPNDRYLHFEEFMTPFLEGLHKQGRITSESFCKAIGEAVDNKESVSYWAAKNHIPTFCPGLTDGSIGDMIYFFKKRRPDFTIDMTDDIVRITDIALNAEKVGIIVLGGSLPKHHVANACLFRDGAEYAVYITTAQEMEGSNAGANVEEAISWGKVKENARHVKVVGEASILFPLIVAGAFKTPVEEGQAPRP